MKKLIAIMFVSAAAFCLPGLVNAQSPATKTGTPVGLPKGATANTDGTWTYKDKNGKKWIYSSSVFGVVKTAATEKPRSQSTSLPKGAVRNADGTYTATAKDGKKWIYSATPFGYSRTGTSPTDEKQGKPGEISFTENGDSVRFERTGMMGKTVWEKKKSELTDEERHVYEARKSNPE